MDGKAVDYGQTKYNRLIRSSTDIGFCFVDVYSVLKAFNVTCPATQHAIKKLLCDGVRGKGDKERDLEEAIVAIRRAITIHKQEENMPGMQAKFHTRTLQPTVSQQKVSKRKKPKKDRQGI